MQDSSDVIADTREITMIKSLSAAAVVVAGAGLIAASPASAAAAPSGAGDLASPAAFHSARVTMHVPAVHCSKSSPMRGVHLGLFVTVVTNGKARPEAITVDATCRAGRSSYQAAFRGHNQLSVRPGDRVRLILSGKDASTFEIDDLTQGDGVGGGGSTSGGGGPQPRADRHVLIGEQPIERGPGSLRATLDNAKVNGHVLAHVAHHKHGQSARVHVSALEHGDFSIRFDAQR